MPTRLVPAFLQERYVSRYTRRPPNGVACQPTTRRRTSVPSSCTDITSPVYRDRTGLPIRSHEPSPSCTRAVYLSDLRTFATNTSRRSKPISASSSSSSLPARPTNGRPCSSSLTPGASPTNMSSASALPAPNTTVLRVAASSLHRTHARARASTSFRASRRSETGRTLSAADTRRSYCLPAKAMSLRGRRARIVRNDHRMASSDGSTSQGELAITAPMAGIVVAIARGPQERVGAGTAVAVLEAMKMEPEVLAQDAGVVRSVEVAVGQAVDEGQVLLVLTPTADEADASPPPAEAPDSGDERSDLAAVRARHALGLDAARPEAVARRRERGRRTARENLAALLDEGTFVEYGPLIF